MATKKASRFPMPTPNSAPDTGLLRALDFLVIDRITEIEIDAESALVLGNVELKAYMDGRFIGTLKIVGGVVIAPGDLRWSHVDVDGKGFAEIWKKESGG